MRLSPFAVLALVPLCASFPAAQKFSFRAEKGQKLEKSFESKLSLDLDEMSVSIGGEEIPPEELGDPQMSMESSTTLQFLDTHEEAGNGRPAKFTRKFVELAGKNIQSAGGGDEEAGSETKEESSELSGKTVRFTWDEEQGKFETTWEGDEGDDELLAGLVEDTDLRSCLPSGDVAEGDKWELDADAFRGMSDPGGDLALKEENDDEDDQKLSRDLRDNMEGKLDATFKGLREVEGGKYAVIALEGEIKTKAEKSESGGEGHSSTMELALTFQVQGEILWDAAAGRAHSFALDCAVVATMSNDSRMEMENQSFEMSQKLSFQGKLGASGSWTLAD